jgi:hypothetical protein
MSKAGFKLAKRKVIAALLNGTFQHETTRASITTKNLLFMGQVTPAEVCALLKRSNGKDHSASPHHLEPSIEVHVIQREGWYVKFYFLDPATIFISVHQ